MLKCINLLELATGDADGVGWRHCAFHWTNCSAMALRDVVWVGPLFVRSPGGKRCRWCGVNKLEHRARFTTMDVATVCVVGSSEIYLGSF